MGVKIGGIGCALGSQVVTAESIERDTGSSEEFRKTKLGIECIRVATAEETPSLLAVRAIENLFEENPSLRREEVDFLIVVTQNPDYKLPTTACLVQHQAKIPSHVLAYDINQGCSGFVIGLANAHALVASGVAKCGILVTVDVYNRHISRKDRNTWGLFGDGAAAVWLEAGREHEGTQKFFFGTDGSGAQDLILKTGGSAYPEKIGDDEDYIYMNGKNILKFVLKTLPSQIHKFLDEYHLKKDDIKHWFFHQANKHMNHMLCAELGIDLDKAFFDIKDTGNLVSASIPFALKKYMQKKQIPFLNDYVMFVGFGVGLSWSGCLYRFE